MSLGGFSPHGTSPENVKVYCTVIGGGAVQAVCGSEIELTDIANVETYIMASN